MRQTTTPAATPDFAALLQSAVTEPGTISAAYSAFQLQPWQSAARARAVLRPRHPPRADRHLPLLEGFGRYVRKGEKAIELCQPITCKRTIENTETGEQDDATFTRFVYRRNWFVLAQTDGQPYAPPAVPGWDKARALAALEVTEAPFELANGNLPRLRTRTEYCRLRITTKLTGGSSELDSATQPIRELS